MKKRRHAQAACPNCGHQFSSPANFCPECGQANHHSVMPLSELLSEFGEHVLHWDSKIFHTLKFLIFKPGYLTVENIQGKRIRYVLPMRLYLIMSFLFFLFVSFLSHTAEENSHAQPSDLVIQFAGISSHDLQGVGSEDLQKFMQDHQMEETVFNRYLVRQLQRMANASSAEYIHMMVKTISYTMFLVVPLVGFWVYLLNRKKRRFYMESLIFSLHFQSFVFLLLAGLLGVIQYPDNAYLFLFALGAFVIWSILYLVLALRRFSGSGWLMAGMKRVLIWVIYWVTQSTLLVLSALISLAIF